MRLVDEMPLVDEMLLANGGTTVKVMAEEALVSPEEPLLVEDGKPLGKREPHTEDGIS